MSVKGPFAWRNFLPPHCQDCLWDGGKDLHLGRSGFALLLRWLRFALLLGSRRGLLLLLCLVLHRLLCQGHPAHDLLELWLVHQRQEPALNVWEVLPEGLVKQLHQQISFQSVNQLLPVYFLSSPLSLSQLLQPFIIYRPNVRLHRCLHFGF